MSQRAEASTTSSRGPGTALSQEVLPYLLVVPLVALLVLMIAYPLVNTVVLSFTNTGVIGAQAEYVGLRNYAEVLRSRSFWAAGSRSLFWVLGNIVVQTLLGFATALLLNRPGRWTAFGRVWILVPWITPTVVVAITWQWITSGSFGVLNYVLQWVGVISQPVTPLGDSRWALPTAIFVNSWHWFPLIVVILLAALQTIPGELYEAASVDGASPVRQFFAITIPVIQPTLFAMGIVGFLWSVNIFDVIYLLTRGGPADVTTTLPVAIYRTAFEGFALGRGAAISVVAMVFVAVVAALYLRFLRPRE